MLALDIEDAEEADDIISSNLQFIDAVKLGTTFLVSPLGGMSFISKIRDKYKLPVLVDAKLKDVPHVLLATARSYISHGASAITCWTDIGHSSLKFLVESLENEIDIVALTALTSIPCNETDQTSKNNIITAVKCGCKYIQIPGNFPDLIIWARNNIPREIKIVSCGVGKQGGIVGEAISCGANYEIIGRKILDCPTKKAMKIAFEKAYDTIHGNFISIR